MADGSGQAKRLLESKYDQGPTSFSPDGKYLLFTEYHPDSLGDIWVLALEDERKVQVFTNSRFNESAPVFSPDGRWVVYQSDESGRHEIYVRPFPGPGAKWSISTMGEEGPRWSRDGRRLFYNVENTVMSVSVRTEGNKLQAGAPRQSLKRNPFSGILGMSSQTESAF